MADRQDILSSYSQAAQAAIDRDETLTPTEFMLASSPGPNVVKYKGVEYNTSYHNADSARRQFSKLQRGEISGEKLHKRGELFTRYAKTEGPRGHVIEAVPGKSGYEHGLWKIVVHMDWTDQDGKEHLDEQRSFVVRSHAYDNYYDAKAVEYESGEAIDDHVADWADGYGVSNVSVTYVEVVRIQFSTLGETSIVPIR